MIAFNQQNYYTYMYTCMSPPPSQSNMSLLIATIQSRNLSHAEFPKAQSSIFLLRINDLPNVSDTLFAILFADDTSVFLEGNDLVEITHILNAELAKLTIWLSANKLTLNSSIS